MHQGHLAAAINDAADPFSGDELFSLRRAGSKHIAYRRKEPTVALILAVLLIALILGGLGFAVHILWWIALVVLAIWLVGFLFRTAEGASGPRRRWYRW